MNREIIRDELGWLLEAIQEQYQALREHEGAIPQIEFDLLMENVRKFYQDLSLLRRLNEPALATDSRPAMQAPPPRAAAPPPPKAAAGGDTPGVTITYSDPEPPAVASEPEPAPAPAPSVQFKPSAVAPRPEPGGARKPAAPAEMDLFAGEEPTFNIRLKDAREKTLGPKIPSGKIDNLKAAITINDKFMFINELFDGNLREYNETIETLNGFMNLDQAADFLDLMRKKNFWNTGSNAFRKLQELVERRF